MIELVDPAMRYQRSYLDASDEFGAAHRDGDGLWVDPPDAARGYAGFALTRQELETTEGFRRLVDRRVGASREDAPRHPDWVPCTFLWAVEDDTYLGSLAVRHRLTETLLREGGHIGYSVRPSARRRGVATAALRLALPVAYRLGIDPVLVTCREDNVASRRVIEACGGVYEDSRAGTRRYWVAAAPSDATGPGAPAGG